ncbi:uncharacterized protein LOC141695544 [Apium graveolens]|uniref:uncharacterized protein LOC141695544 n=1 Tax=Apium graveolens TaxID=4045 RepID=UPI003D79B4A2
MSSTYETPFILAYGTNALFPVEVGMCYYRTEVFSNESNVVGLRANIDLLEEEREAAHQRNLKYQLQAAQYCDSGGKKRNFFIGDLVLRELATSMPTNQGKLRSNWEDPYSVAEVIRLGIYKLKIMPGEPIKNTWHTSTLRTFF